MDQAAASPDLTDTPPHSNRLVTTEERHLPTGKPERRFLEDAYLLRRGSPPTKKEKRSQAFSGVPRMMANKSFHPGSKLSPIRSHREGEPPGRWLTDAEKGAGRLAARVMVNRPGNITSPKASFRRQVIAPGHASYAPGIARRKRAVHRLRLGPKATQLILTTPMATSSALREDAAEPDPHNHCSGATHHRLEAEVIRDRMLAVSGLLDRTMYGKGTLDEAMFRRSIYFEIKRAN